MKFKQIIIFLGVLVISTQIINGGISMILQNKTEIENANKFNPKKYEELNKFYSNKKLGSFVKNGKTTFRLFAPDAKKVILCTYNELTQKIPKQYPMTVDKNGVWEISLNRELYGVFYGYKVYSENDIKTGKNVVVSVDPYAKVVATYTTFMNPRRAIVYKDNYDWGSDRWIQRDWRDLIIYEMHIRDMTIDPSSQAKHAGSYEGLTEHNIRGGIDYIKSLGVNTVELMPAMEYANIEIPYKDSLDGMFNTWNPYERNHWGYMTSNFFAPAAYYSTDWKTMKWNTWMGSDASQVNQFKDMVKAFHKEGIGVMMDVVFNHLSEYELGNLKQIDKDYYFRLDSNGNFISKSYTGNDLKTERPMVRRLIVESVLYWMKNYHIDGFRFDLGKLIDWKTIETIIREAKKINPNVVFVCEPWGGGYDPTGFSVRGWGAWNDQIRNGIKGENPFNGLGWIFGKWYGNNNIKRVESYVNGTLLRDKYGLFTNKKYSVNYLASHDGYTLGDFIRIGSKAVDPNKIVTNVDKFVKLTPQEMKLNKLAALFLFTSQGITMFQEGAEFARTKVIPLNIKVPDIHKGHIDNNSYNKDNATNYINYKHAQINKELVDYYRGLIALRNTYPAFRRAKYDNIHFVELKSNEFALGYFLKYENSVFFVGFNADPQKKANFKLPKGKWDILVNSQKAGFDSIGVIRNSLLLQPITGTVLKMQ